MDWESSLQNFLQDSLVPSSTEPPYALIFVGLFILFTCGLAFALAATSEIGYWYGNPSAQRFARWESLRLLIPFVGGLVGFWVFLGASLQVFGVPGLLSWALALVLSGFTGFFTWGQLGRNIGRGVLDAYVNEEFHPHH